MRTNIRLNTLALLLVIAVALAALPALAQPTPPHGPLHPKSAAGLMSPVYILDPAAPAPMRSVAATTTLFGTPINTTSGGWAQVLAATDLTGDGKAEAAVGTGQYFDPANDRQAHVFSWNGGGLTRLQKQTIAADPEAAQVVDLNLDGRADLVLALPGSNQLAVYTQTITVAAPLSSPVFLAQPGAPDALAAGDFDGDLRPDLAAAAPLSDTIRFWHSSPQGLLPMALKLPFPTDGFDALAAGDFNDDGQDDIAALRGSGYQTNSAIIFLQRNGAFPTSYTLSPKTGGYLPNSLAAGDLDGDGLDNLVVTAGGNTPSAYLNVFLQGAGALTPAPATYPTYHIPSAVAIGDVNHDGRDDVVVVHDGWRTLSVFLQNGGHTLDQPLTADIPYSSRFRPTALALADFNGDGGLDIGLVGKEAGLTVLLNTLPAPTAAIVQPPEAALLPPGTLVVSGTASASATSVEVRLRGAGTGWVAAPVIDGIWQATLTLPAEGRPWWIDARAVDAAGRYQAPPAHRRIRVETFAYTVADNGGASSSPDRLAVVGLSTAHTTLVGDTGTEHIEALAFRPGTPTLYAADAGQLGTLDLANALFTPTAARFGKGRGAKGTITLNDVDGLAFDPATGALYGVHRRPRSSDKDLLFRIDPATGARVPDAFGAGKDYVVVDGPGVPSNVDDLAFDPTTGTLYAAANNGGGSGSVLLTVDRQSGAATVVGAFGADDLEGLGFTSDGRLYGTTGDAGSTRNQLYAIDKASGAATAIGPLAGQRDYESLAVPPAGLPLPAPVANAALPHVDSVTIGDGAASTASQATSLQASISAPDNRARWMLFVEHQYDPATGEWMRATPALVRSSDWRPYTTPSSRYDWQLSSTPGVKYLQAWAADGAGRLSRLPYQAFVNYIPASDSLARDEARVYRYALRAGEQLTARVETMSGDADLYVWSSDPDVPPWASNLSSGADEVSFVAPDEGVYQVEVRGSRAATYRLAVTVTQGTVTAQATAGVNADKPLPEAPAVPVDSAPSLRQAAPAGPAIDQAIYLSIVSR